MNTFNALMNILLAALASIVIGSLWYSPLLFGKIWMEEKGIKKCEMDAAAKKMMAKSYAVQVVASLLTAFIMSNVATYGGANTYGMGAALGFSLWLGFSLTATMGTVAWEGKLTKSTMVTVSNNLVTYVAMGMIVAGLS